MGSVTYTCTCNIVHVAYPGIFVNEVTLKDQYKGEHKGNPPLKDYL